MGLSEIFKEVGYILLFRILGFVFIVVAILIPIFIKNPTLGGILIFILLILATFFLAVAERIRRKGL